MSLGTGQAPSEELGKMRWNFGIPEGLVEGVSMFQDLMTWKNIVEQVGLFMFFFNFSNFTTLNQVLTLFDADLTSNSSLLPYEPEFFYILTVFFLTEVFRPLNYIIYNFCSYCLFIQNF